MMALLVLTACSRIVEPDIPQPAPEGERVQLTFQVAVPTDEVSTKAMDLNPTIDPNGFYIAVFGGSGFFNEWVKATVVSATANYNNTNNTVYNITASLTVSDSRLRLHFIGNCPTAVRNSPPISGSADTEEYVMSRIRSQKTDTYNDGYWAKVILPHGIRANGVATGNGNEIVYEPTQETLAQFPTPIVMVRDFARVYLRNLTPTYTVNGNSHQLVTIKKYALAYAPSEGVIAPILAAPYMSDENGNYLAEEPAAPAKIYYEGFYMDYRNGALATDMLTHGIFSYTGTAPANQKFEYYPNNNPKDVPVSTDFIDWHSNESENILYVYERSIPSTGSHATRIIILAERVDEYGHSEGDKYYALDIVNPDGATIPLLRNQTYTVLLKNIEAGSGETDIANAARANSATVSGDPEFQSLTNISDGQSSIATSFTEMFYVAPQLDSVMFRYIPTSAGDATYAAGAVGNELVTVKVGTVNMSTGVFTEQTPAAASSAGVLAFKTDASGYKVWISKDQSDNVIQYVRYNNAWVPFDSGNAAHANLEKWGKIYYELNPDNVDSGGYYTQERTQAIHVTGTYNNKEMSRNVIIKLSPRQEISVSCLQKYVLAATGQREQVRVYIPSDLSRSVFPLDFKIEPNGYSLTPYGDILPVTSGVSIDPNNEGPAYYFIKELTKSAYDGLPTLTVGGTTWKYFTCTFKTTLAQNACTVYVENKYFNTDNAHDFFSNYYQRLFSSLTLPATISYGAEVQFSFVMDAEHSSGETVWWDPANNLSASVSNSNRVLPKVMRVELQGLKLKYQADGTTPWDGDDTIRLSLESSDTNTDTYTYNVGLNASTASVNPQFTFVVKGNVGTDAKVTLSTANLSDNPNLYASNSISKTIQGAAFSALEFTSASQFYGIGQTVYVRFVYQNGLIEPATLTLTGLEYVGNDARISGSNGVYTFTPSAVNISDNLLEYTLPFRTTGQNGGMSVTLDAQGYVSRSISRAAVTGISLNKSSVTLASNVAAYSTTTLTATVTPANLSPAPAIVWTSDNTDVATVDNNGVVNAVRNGVAHITASVGSYSATCTVTVRKRVQKTGTYTWTATNNNRNTDSFTDNTSGITITFANYSGQNGYKEMSTASWSGGNDGTITISATNSSLDDCVLTGATITYNRSGNTTYNSQTVTANTGSITNSKQTWTASGSGNTSVTITMAYSWNNKNRVSGLSISYGYYDWEQ